MVGNSYGKSGMETESTVLKCSTLQSEFRSTRLSFCNLPLLDHSLVHIVCVSEYSRVILLTFQNSNVHS